MAITIPTSIFMKGNFLHASKSLNVVEQKFLFPLVYNVTFHKSL